MTDFSPGVRAPELAHGHRYVHVVGSAVWMDSSPASPLWVSHLLGMLGDQAVWAVDVPHGEDPADGAALDLYSLHGRTSEVEWAVAGRAVQIVEWARTHRFCGRCGAANESQPHERSMRCPQCGLAAFPRLAPAMVTLVTRGEGAAQEALLARGVQFRVNMYSCLAGFVEPGESLEAAVVREVREEVGVEVDDVRYVSSQPWPFPHSLMVGFRARHAAGDIVCDPTEIVDAGWFSRSTMRGPRAPAIPPAISIARTLIDAWLAEG